MSVSLQSITTRFKNIATASHTVVTLAFVVLFCLAGFLILVRIVRGNQDPTYMEGAFSLVWGIGLPLGVCIKTHDNLVKSSVSTKVNELAPMYLLMFIGVSVLIFVALTWFTFIGTTDVPRTAPNGQTQVFQEPIPFGEAARWVCIWTAPFISLLLGLTIFQASKLIESSNEQ